MISCGHTIRDLAPRPPLSRQQVVCLSHLTVCQKSSLPTGEGGKWWAKSNQQTFIGFFFEQRTGKQAT